MLVAALSLLGVPLWLTLGWLAAALWHRHELKQLPGLFELRVRLVSGSYRHIDGNYPRMAEHGLWAHDVLIIEKGFFLGRNLHFAVADGVQPPQPADPKQVKGLGDNPFTMRFRLDDRTVIEVAAPGEMATVAQGPFFSNAT